MLPLILSSHNRLCSVSFTSAPPLIFTLPMQQRQKKKTPICKMSWHLFNYALASGVHSCNTFSSILVKRYKRSSALPNATKWRNHYLLRLHWQNWCAETRNTSSAYVTTSPFQFLRPSTTGKKGASYMRQFASYE
jgi:hypothetical protein